ncbi:cytochrome P450 [Humibacter albus]|uniref:cytochrome P450 n=1 Tax=Humibacter albus TaxID=427754 RepID=UPI0004082EC4|nr:cytochrome P450 [Humibacter albus]
MIPTISAVDGALGLVQDGYLFGIRRFERLHTDAFRTRLLGHPTVVARGAHAARFFYENGRFARVGAIPASVSHLLQDEGSVQTLEGDAHRTRKRLFVETMGVQGRERLLATFDEEWERASVRWARAEAPVVLHDEFVHLLALAALRWSGIPDDLWLPRFPELRDSLAGMVDHAASFGPVNWGERSRRRRVEDWAVGVVERVRSGAVTAAEASPLARIAAHEDGEGIRLPHTIAAVELLNLLRPIVAVARFLEFAAVALYRHPEHADAFRRNHDEDLPGFAQEVRRFYPFFPLIAGRATRRLTWNGAEFEAGDRMVLDLYGTDHDPRLWPSPRRFDPGRFRHPLSDRNALVAQGGGEYADGHRCPGEPATQDLIEHTLRRLVRLDYSMPPQDLRISLRKMPAKVADGVLITDVKTA